MSAEIRTDDLLQNDQSAARDDQAARESKNQLEPLFDPGHANELRDRWSALQARFVDDPRKTV